MQITAAVTRHPGAMFTVEQLELQEPRDDEVLVRIAGVGICHTDLIARDQIIPTRLPAVLGHEGSGIVEQVGSAVEGLCIGDHVVLSFLSCGRCAPCLSGHPAYCDSMPALNFRGVRPDDSSALSCDGQPVSGHFFGQSSFATYAIAKARNTVKVETSLPLEILGPLGCGIMAGAGTVFNVLDCQPGSSIAIFGGGPVGMSALLAAVARGCSPILIVEPMASRREMALELGATHAIDPGAHAKIVDGVLEILPLGADFVVEATGIVPVVEAAFGSVKKQGTCALVGAPSKPGETTPLRTGLFVQMGVTLRGVIEGDSDPKIFIPELLALQAKGRFPFEKLITVYDLTQINEAVADQKAGKSLKVVLRTGGATSPAPDGSTTSGAKSNQGNER